MVFKITQFKIEQTKKCVLSGAGPAEYQLELPNITKMNRDAQEPRKYLRPLELSQSEIVLQKIVQV